MSVAASLANITLVRVFGVLIAYIGPNFEPQDTSQEFVLQRHTPRLGIASLIGNADSEKNQLNFTANCSNLALGLYVFENDFQWQSPNPGNYHYDNDSYHNSTVDDGPSEYFEDFWTNGTSPEWISFWRYTLSSVLPQGYLSLSDAEIASWANTTVCILSEQVLPYLGLLLGKQDLFREQEAFGTRMSCLIARRFTLEEARLTLNFHRRLSISSMMMSMLSLLQTHFLNCPTTSP